MKLAQTKGNGSIEVAEVGPLLAGRNPRPSGRGGCQDPRWSRAKMGQPSNGFRKLEGMPEFVAHVRGEGKVCQSLESHLYGVGRFLQG